MPLIHWPLEEGIVHDRCMNIYFEFSQQLNWQRRYFEEHYGFVPKSLKRRPHCGQVVAAGCWRRNKRLVFSDVLNTLARLQDQCNPFGATHVDLGALRDV